MNTPNDILLRLSPVLHSKKEYAKLLLSLHTTPIPQIAQAQADALTPIWDTIASHPNATHTAKSLNRMFRDVSRYYNFAQTQRPIIGIYLDDISGQFSRLQNTQTLKKYGRAHTVYSGDYSNFGTIKIHTQDLPYRYQFSFLTFTKLNEDPDIKHIVNMPIVTLNQTLLHETIQAQGQDFLSAFQDALAISNHDFIHHLTTSYVFSHLINTEHLLNLRSKLQSLYDFDHEEHELYISPKSKEQLNLKGYSFVNSFVEGHALLSHKKIYEQAGTTAQDITTINTMFDLLEDLLPKTTSAWDIGAYYTLVLYDRLLSVMPHTHPVIQTLEQRASALPLPHELWKKVVTNFIQSSDNNTSLKLKLAHNGILPLISIIQSQPTTAFIRAAAQMDNLNFFSQLHRNIKYKADATALDDLDKIISDAKLELSVMRRHERNTRAQRAHDNLKNRPC